MQDIKKEREVKATKGIERKKQVNSDRERLMEKEVREKEMRKRRITEQEKEENKEKKRMKD